MIPRRRRRRITVRRMGVFPGEMAKGAQVNGPARVFLPNRRRLARGALTLAAGAWAALAGAAVAAEDQPKVRIEGGADATGHDYRWTVTNQHTSPIVYIEFPHFRADLFTPPEGWTQECHHLVGLRESKTGLPMCSATADEGNPGIVRGQSATFQMRIAPKGAKRGRREVKIRFADGRTTIVAGVELPRPETAAERYTRLVGFGVLFVVFLLGRAVWTRRRKSEQSAPPAVS